MISIFVLNMLVVPVIFLEPIKLETLFITLSGQVQLNELLRIKQGLEFDHLVTFEIPNVKVCQLFKFAGPVKIFKHPYFVGY